MNYVDYGAPTGSCGGSGGPLAQPRGSKRILTLASKFIFAALLAAAFPGGAYAVDWYTGVETAPAARQDWIVAFDAATTVTSNASAFGTLTTTLAVASKLDQSGPRIRLQDTAGVYSYPLTTASGGLERGTQEQGAVLTGYEWIWSHAAIGAFVGFDARHNALQVPDPSNPVVGTGVGARAAIDVFFNPTPFTFFQTNATYSTEFHSYYARMRGGWMVANNIYVGPEGTVLGDSFFNQYRIGAQVMGIGFGPLNFGVGGGYAYDRQQKSGYYSSIEGRAAF